MRSTDKIKSHHQLLAILRKLKKQGKSTAFTNGCFDILHSGHIKYLEAAKDKADILLVAVNTDLSVKKIKGPGRPINKQSDRIRVLSAISCIDYLTFFGEATPLNLIKLLKPDVLIKGGDWDVKNIVGSDVVKSYGGNVISIPYLKGFSTTNLIKKINAL